MMKVLFFFIVIILGVANASEDNERNHNGPQHKALCEVLKIAAHKWKKVRETLSPTLKKALARTLFGKEEGELEELKDLPVDYDKVGEPGSSRAIWCGQPLNGDYQNNYPRWSGHSATHDLVCLCTIGEGGFPLNKTGSGTAKEKLCGKPANALGGATDGWQSQSSSWDDKKKELVHPEPKGKEHITATWENVTRPCLEGGGKGESLKAALKEFTGKLVPQPITGQENRKQLGEGTPGPYTACTGSPSQGLCVMYYPKLTPKTWWVELEKAIQEDEKIQEQKRRDEEGKRREQEDAEKQDSQKTETLKSTLTTTNQTDQQHRNDNFTEKLRKFNLTGSSSIILPSSWLLSAATLI